MYRLRSVSEDALIELLKRAIQQCYPEAVVNDGFLAGVAKLADGDVRQALNLLELAADLTTETGLETRLDEAVLEQLVATGMRRFDKGGDAFYEQISALHKSVRGSDPDAALYWFARMLDGGCDPLYIARRCVRMASEDIGLADPRALQLTLDATAVQERLGSPEGELAIAQAVVYLACAAKSNAVYSAFNAATASAKQSGSAEVPMHLRNAPTALLKDEGYGAGYRYAHDEPSAFAAGVQYFPDDVTPTQFYEPTDRGLEVAIKEKLDRLRAMNRQAQQEGKP